MKFCRFLSGTTLYFALGLLDNSREELTDMWDSHLSHRDLIFFSCLCKCLALKKHSPRVCSFFSSSTYNVLSEFLLWQTYLYDFLWSVLLDLSWRLILNIPHGEVRFWHIYLYSLFWCSGGYIYLYKNSSRPLCDTIRSVWYWKYYWKPSIT